MTITITTILIIFSMILGGTSATVYAAQDSLPEQTLYPVKVLSEDLAIQIPRSPARKLVLLLDYADRRVTELGALVDSGDQPPESLVERYEVHLDRALQLVSEMEASRMLAALTQVQSRLEKQARYLENLPHDGALLIRARETIRLRLRWAEFGLADPEQFRHQARERHRFHQPPEFPGGFAPGPNPEAPGAGYGPGPNQPPGSGDGEGPWCYATGTPNQGDGYGPGSCQTPGGGGYGPGPCPTGTPTPGSGYGPGPGPNPSHTPGSGEGYGPGPYVTGTPTPGSGYGSGPGPDPTCTCPNPGEGNCGGFDPHPPGNHAGKGGKE